MTGIIILMYVYPFYDICCDRWGVAPRARLYTSKQDSNSLSFFHQYCHIILHFISRLCVTSDKIVGKMASMWRRYARRGIVELRSLAMYIDMIPRAGINTMDRHPSSNG